MTDQVVPKVTQIVPKDSASSGSTPAPDATPKAVAQILPTGPSLPGGPGGPSLPGGPGGSGPSGPSTPPSAPTQIVGSIVNTVTTAPTQLLQSVPALPGPPGPSGPGSSGPTPLVGSIVDTIARTPAQLLPSVQALPILPSGSGPSGPSGPIQIVGSIVDTIARTPAQLLPSVQALPILPSGSGPSGPSGPIQIVGSIVDTIARTPAQLLPSVQALPILPSGSGPSGPSGPIQIVGSIVDTIARTPAQLLPSVPTNPSSQLPTLISPATHAALLIPSQTVAPAPVVDGTGAGVGAPPGPLDLNAILPLVASPGPSRPQSRQASSAPASGPSGTVSSPIAAPSGHAIGSTAPPAPRTGTAPVGGLALIAEALGFGAMFGLPTIVSIRFTDILLPGPAIQFLTSYGLQLPGGLTLFDSSRAVGDGATQPTPDRTPIPAPDALLHAVAGAQASLTLGGLLAVLFLTLLTAPYMGRQLRVPATSWWSPGYVSPVELPG